MLLPLALVAGLAMPTFAAGAVFRCPDGSYQDKPCDKGGGKVVTPKPAVVRSSPDAGGAADTATGCRELESRRDRVIEQQRTGATRARMDTLERTRRDLDRQIRLKKCEK